MKQCFLACTMLFQIYKSCLMCKEHDTLQTWHSLWSKASLYYNLTTPIKSSSPIHQPGNIWVLESSIDRAVGTVTRTLCVPFRGFLVMKIEDIRLRMVMYVYL